MLHLRFTCIMFFFYFLFLAAQAAGVLCNTEKIIFVAPEAIQIPTAHPTLSDLHIDALTPLRRTIRTHLRADFPKDGQENGLATWLLLDNLVEGQRYEVRVCWAAIQPTAFKLEIYDLQSVFGKPELVTSLAEYSATRQPTTNVEDVQVVEDIPNLTASEQASSTLFLQVLAAADYYTMDRILMLHVPPVYVDIILDPYLLNVFPQSLVPTALHIIATALGAWFLSVQVRRWIINLQSQNLSQDKKTA